MVPRVAVELVEELKNIMPIVDVCRHLGISRASYYRWKANGDKPTKKEIRDQQIGELCKKHKFRYGYRKIADFFPGISQKTVQRVMQKHGWQCRVKVKKRKQTGQPAHVAQNLIARDFTATKPLEKLLTDITYLPFGQSMMYLSSIMIIMSMSRKGTPADNSPIETFHSSLKSETFYLDEIYHTTNAHVIQIVEEYINYYNNIRIQTKLGNRSPVQYREQAA